MDPQGFKALEHHRLLSMSVVRSCDNGAIVLADNEVLAATLQEIEGGQARSAQAIELLRTFKHAGLFNKKPVVSLQEARIHQNEQSVEMLFGAGRHNVLVRCDDVALARDIGRIVAPLRIKKETCEPHLVEIVSSREEYTVVSGGIVVSDRNDLAVARHCVLSEILTVLHGRGTITAILHAASIAKEGKGIILAGDSGSGKSTLAHALAQSGWGLVADDLTALDRNALIRAFPTRISLKPGSWQRLPAEDLRRATVGNLGDMDVRYVDPDEAMTFGTEIQAIGICFPRWDPASNMSVEKISPELALTRLIRCGGRVAGTDNSIEPLARLVRQTPAYEITYPDTASALNFCASIAAQ